MLVKNEGDWENRSLVYMCRNYDTIKSSDAYDKVLPAHHIGILNFALPDEEPEFYSHYYLTNAKTRKIYNDNFRLSVLHLNYIELATQEDIDSGLKDWADFFKATSWEELKMLAKKNPVFEDAANTYYQLIQDPYVRADYEMLERDRAHERNREKLVVFKLLIYKIRQNRVGGSD